MVDLVRLRVGVDSFLPPPPEPFSPASDSSDDWAAFCRAVGLILGAWLRFLAGDGDAEAGADGGGIDVDSPAWWLGVLGCDDEVEPEPEPNWSLSCLLSRALDEDDLERGWGCSGAVDCFFCDDEVGCFLLFALVSELLSSESLLSEATMRKGTENETGGC
jgi:hypothetical protein